MNCDGNSHHTILPRNSVNRQRNIATQQDQAEEIPFNRTNRYLEPDT
ncbi:hypothetical protein OAF56_01580 [Pirellulaceae bacterium]|nr:hypothetical protein [Pirellulaceae bacterium]